MEDILWYFVLWIKGHYQIIALHGIFSSQTKRSDVSHFQMLSCHATQEWVECIIIINLQYLRRYGEEQTLLCAYKITWCLEAYLDKYMHNGNTTFNAIHSHYCAGDVLIQL